MDLLHKCVDSFLQNLEWRYAIGQEKLLEIGSILIVRLVRRVLSFHIAGFREISTNYLYERDFILIVRVVFQESLVACKLLDKSSRGMERIDRRQDNPLFAPVWSTVARAIVSLWRSDSRCDASVDWPIQHRWLRDWMLLVQPCAELKLIKIATIESAGTSLIVRCFISDGPVNLLHFFLESCTFHDLLDKVLI